MPEENIDTCKLSKLCKLVNEYEKIKEDMPVLKIAFLRNFTVEPIIPYMKFLSYQQGLRPDIYIGGYDNIIMDAMEGDSALYRHSPEVIVIFLKLEILSENLALNFTALTQQQISEEIIRIKRFINSILTAIRKNSKTVILVHNFEVEVYPSLGILDYQHASKQVNTIRKLNLDLLEIAGEYTNIYVIDNELLMSEAGYINFIDNRYWHIVKAPYTQQANRMFVKEYMKFILALKGKNKKCLALDCDNTLWGGIIGEDGIDGIKLGDAWPGSSYKEFQKSILNLYHRGILLALCSKNRKEDVEEVLESHPDMVLKKNHFVAMEINWSDKAANLRKIARDLNIGIDSIVFIDDNAYEVGLVKNMLPEAAAILLPSDPSSYSDILNSCGLFDSLVFSDEDRRRSEMYKTEAIRRSHKERFTDPEDYYKYLGMEIMIGKPCEISISRAAQLIQRTNQFNLTVKRYQENEMKEMVKTGTTELYCLKLKDRLGDYGIVGVTLLQYKGSECIIDIFLMSCRVIGRGVEDVFLKFCINQAANKRCKTISGEYVPTEKNSIAKDFFLKHKFSRSVADAKSKKFHLSVNGVLPEYPSYFKITINDNVL